MKVSTLLRRFYLRLISCPTHPKEAHSVSTEICALVFASTRSITRNSARPREKLRLTPRNNKEKCDEHISYAFTARMRFPSVACTAARDCNDSTTALPAVPSSHR